MSDDKEFEYDGPSKSQVKREMHELQRIGQRLVDLPKSDRARIPLSEKLIDAIDIAHRIKSREALRRQIAYIGKVMRATDQEPIIEALEKIDRGHLELAHRFRRVEAMRDKVITQGSDALKEIFATYPEANRQQLGQYARQIAKEVKQDKPPATARKLFKYLRELEDER